MRDLLKFVKYMCRWVMFHVRGCFYLKCFEKVHYLRFALERVGHNDTLTLVNVGWRNEFR